MSISMHLYMLGRKATGPDRFDETRVAGSFAHPSDEHPFDDGVGSSYRG
jgi:hypothetical protein